MPTDLLTVLLLLAAAILMFASQHAGDHGGQLPARGFHPRRAAADPDRRRAQRAAGTLATAVVSIGAQSSRDAEMVNPLKTGLRIIRGGVGLWLDHNAFMHAGALAFFIAVSAIQVLVAFFDVEGCCWGLLAALQLDALSWAVRSTVAVLITTLFIAAQLNYFGAPGQRRLPAAGTARVAHDTPDR